MEILGMQARVSEPTTHLTETGSVMNSLRRIVLALRVWAQEDEGSTGLSGAQTFVLERLAEEPGQSLTRLAERTLTSKAAVSVVVSRLVERDLVRRRASTTDGRSVMLDLTAGGRRALEKAPQSPAARVVSALQAMPKADLASLAQQLERLVDELGIGGLEARMMFENEGELKVAAPKQRRVTPPGLKPS